MKIDMAPKEYSEGKMTIKLEPTEHRDYDLEFELEILVSDLNKLIALKAELMKEDVVDRETKLIEQTDIVEKIVRRSYPSFNDQQIQSIMAKDGTMLLLEIKLACQLEDREAWNALKKRKELELKKLVGEDDTTRKSDSTGTSSPGESSPVQDTE